MLREGTPKNLMLTPEQEALGRKFLTVRGVHTVDQAQEIGDDLGIDFLLDIGIEPDGHPSYPGCPRLFSDEMAEGGLEAMWNLIPNDLA